MSKSNNIVKWDTGNNIVDSGISITSIGSGGMTLIGSYDYSVNGSVANYTLTWTATYKTLLLITKNMTGDGAGAYFVLQTSSDSGSNWGNEINVHEPKGGSTVLTYSITNMYSTGVSGPTKDCVVASNPSYGTNDNSLKCITSSTTGIINAIKYSYVSSAQNINGGKIWVYGIN